MSDDRDIVDEEDLRAMEAYAQGIPLEYGRGEQHVGTQRLLSKPSRDEVAIFQKTQVRTCGQCRYFDRAAFQAGGVREGFMARLIHDYQWNPQFIGDHPSKMGRCKQDESRVTGPNSLGCSAFKVK